MTDLMRTVAGVIKAHHLLSYFNASGRMARCRCDLDGSHIGWTQFDEWADHVAELVVAALPQPDPGKQRHLLWREHKALAEAAHERGDIPEANYQYGWVDA